MSRSRRGLSWPLYQKQLPDSSRSYRWLGFIFFVVFTSGILLKCDSWLTALSPLPRTLQSIHVNSPPMTWTHLDSQHPRRPSNTWHPCWVEIPRAGPWSIQFTQLSWSRWGRSCGAPFYRWGRLARLLTVTLWLRQARSCWLPVQCFCKYLSFCSGLQAEKVKMK